MQLQKRNVVYAVFVFSFLLLLIVLYFSGFFHFLNRAAISIQCNRNKLGIERCYSEEDVFANGPLLEAYSNDLTPKSNQELYTLNGIYLGRFGDKLLVWTTRGIVRWFQISSTTQFGVSLVIEKNDKSPEVVNRYISSGELTAFELPINVVEANPELEGIQYVNGANISRETFIHLIGVGTRLGVVYAKGSGSVYKFTLLEL